MQRSNLVVWNEKGPSKGRVYNGAISSYDDSTGKHSIVFDDETVENVDLFDCYNLISEWRIIPNSANDREETDITVKARNKRLEERNKMEPQKTVMHFITRTTTRKMFNLHISPNPNPNPTTQINQPESKKRKREDLAHLGSTKFGRACKRTEEVTSINESRNESTESINKRKKVLL